MGITQTMCDIIESVVHLFAWAWSCILAYFSLVEFLIKIRSLTKNLCPEARFLLSSSLLDVRPSCLSVWSVRTSCSIT